MGPAEPLRAAGGAQNSFARDRRSQASQIVDDLPCRVLRGARQPRGPDHPDSNWVVGRRSEVSFSCFLLLDKRKKEGAHRGASRLAARQGGAANSALFVVYISVSAPPLQSRLPARELLPARNPPVRNPVWGPVRRWGPDTADVACPSPASPASRPGRSRPRGP